MDKKKIIENGLLELYLLGELALAEKDAVEAALQKDSGLREMYASMEDDFQKMAFENAIEPPASVRKSLEKALDDSEPISIVKSFENESSKNKKSYFPLAAAASLAVLFALGSLWMYNRWQTSENRLLEMQQQTSDLQNRLSDLEKNYQETNKKYLKISDPNTLPLLLVGNQTIPDSHAVAYINHTTKEVVLNPQGLKKLASDKTYQMWADVEGEMINMGVVPNKGDLIALEYIDNAESLNITIEPAGGSDHATVENLVASVVL